MGLIDYIHGLCWRCNQGYKKPYYKNTNVKIQKIQEQCSNKKFWVIFVS